MELPFNSVNFKTAIQANRSQFHPPALADDLLDMIADYEQLLNKSSNHGKRESSSQQGDDPEIVIITKGKGAILEKHKKKITLAKLPVSINHQGKVYKVHEYVNIYFIEIGRLEELLQKH